MAKERAIQLSGEELDRMRALILVNVDESKGATFEANENVARSREYYKDRRSTDTPAFEGGSTINVPVVKTSTSAIQAEVDSSLFNITPLIHVSGAFAPWDKIEDAMEKFYARLYNLVVPLKKVGKRTERASLRDGAAIVKVCWRKESRKIRRWETEEVQEVDPATMQTVVVEKSVRNTSIMLTADGPGLEFIPIDKFGIFPSHNTELQDAAGCWAEYTVTGDFLLQKGMSGEYDLEAVKKVLEFPTQGAPSAEDDRFGVSQTEVSTSSDKDDAMRDIEIIEVWRMYRPKLSEPNERWLFVIERKTNTMLKATPSPYDMDRWPFALCRPYDAMVEGIYGDSVASSGGGHVQETKSRLFRFADDLASRRLNPRMGVAQSQYSFLKKQFGDKAFEAFKKPGAVIPIPDMVMQQGGNAYMTLDDARGPAEWMPIYELASMEGEQATGASDQRKGSAGAVAKTAREAMIIEASSKKLMSTIRENVAECIREVATLVHMLCYQYRDSPLLQQMWEQINPDLTIEDGFDEVDDGQGGILQQPRRVPVTFEMAMDGAYDFAANGLSEETNRMLQSEQATEIMAILAQEPAVWGDPEHRYNALFNILKAKGISKPEKYLGTEEEFIEAVYAQQQQAMMMEQQAMVQGMPEVGGGAVPPGSTPIAGSMAPSGSVTGVQPAGDVMPNLQGQEEIYAPPAPTN